MWFYAAIGMACVSGIFTILAKHTLKTISPIILFWVVTLVSIPFVFLTTQKNELPGIDSYFIYAVIGAIIFYIFAKIIFNTVIKEADLSDVHPLLAIGPIFTLLFSLIIFSDKLSLLQIVGTIVTILGTYTLNISTAHKGYLEPFKILFKNKLALWMLVSVFLGSIVPIFDKLAINHTYPQDPIFTLLVENIFIVIALMPWIASKRNTAFAEIKAHKVLILLLGILGATSNMLAMYALTGSNPGVITSLMRTQIFFVLFFSYIFFGDKPKNETILGTVIMILGVIITKLGS